jgi:hypothetical protein
MKKWLGENFCSPAKLNSPAKRRRQQHLPWPSRGHEYQAGAWCCPPPQACWKAETGPAGRLEVKAAQHDKTNGKLYLYAMISKERILEIIYMAVEEFNAMQEEDEQLEPRADEVLFSRAGFTKEGKLDSMGLVNFLVTLDELLDNDEDTVGLQFDISEALEKKETVLKDINALADYIVAKNKKS